MDGRHGYVSLLGNPQQVGEFDTATHAFTRYFTTGACPINLAITSDGKYVISSDRCQPGLTVINTGTGQTAQMQFPSGFPDRIVTDADNVHAYVVGLNGTSLWKVKIDQSPPMIEAAAFFPSNFTASLTDIDAAPAASGGSGYLYLTMGGNGLKKLLTPDLKYSDKRAALDPHPAWRRLSGSVGRGLQSRWEQGVRSLRRTPEPG